MEKILGMNSGQGEYSYAQNSSLWQKNILLSVKPILEKSIKSWKNTFECKTLCIADLGCSSGSNTLFITEIITEAIREKYDQEGMGVPDFQVSYNDLPSNDFNSLFALIEALPQAPERSRNFVAAVPGSFYSSLFPPNTLHFIVSSSSLHWLSQVPPEVGDKNSKCWNRGRIWISEEGPAEFVEAYFAQFQRDFNAFLKARAKEVVVGGRMFLEINVRTSAEKRRKENLFLGMLGCAINELVSQGVIEEEKLDSFNLPIYFPTAEEMTGEVLKQGSFTVVGLEIVHGVLSNMNAYYNENGKEAFVGFLSKQVRAIFQGLISYHFGEEITNSLFHTYAKLLESKMDQLMEYSEQSECVMALTLERGTT